MSLAKAFSTGRNSALSLRRRRRTTASSRATATWARAIPRALTTFMPQARRTAHLLLRTSKVWAASHHAVRGELVAAPADLALDVGLVGLVARQRQAEIRIDVSRPPEPIRPVDRRPGHERRAGANPRGRSSGAGRPPPGERSRALASSGRRAGAAWWPGSHAAARPVYSPRNCPRPVRAPVRQRPRGPAHRPRHSPFLSTAEASGKLGAVHLIRCVSRQRTQCGKAGRPSRHARRGGPSWSAPGAARARPRSGP